MVDFSHTLLSSTPRYRRLVPAFVRSLFKSTPGTLTLPSNRIVLPNVLINLQHKAEYDSLLHWPLDSVAPGYLHILSFPLQLLLLLDKSVPFPLLGLLHVSNSVSQWRSVHIDEPLTIQCFFTELQPHPRGYLLELVTEIYAAEQLVYQASHRYLRKVKLENQRIGAGKTYRSGAEQVSIFQGEDTQLSQTWQLQQDLGRQYARCSGDYNPIHLYPWSAKLLGLKQPIAHGMCMKSRILSAFAQLYPEVLQGAYHCEFIFKKPLFLPNSVDFHHRSEQANRAFQFALSSDSAGQDIQHIEGSLSIIA
jgi:acyl dehydratase